MSTQILLNRKSYKSPRKLSEAMIRGYYIDFPNRIEHNNFSIDALVAKVNSKKIHVIQFGMSGETSKTFYFNKSPCTVDMYLEIIFNTFESNHNFAQIKHISVQAVPIVRGEYERIKNDAGFDVVNMSILPERQQFGLLVWPGLPSILDALNVQIQNTLKFTPYRVGKKWHPSRFPYPRDRYTIRGPPESYHAWQVPKLGPKPLHEMPSEPFYSLRTELHITDAHAKNIRLEDIWKILNHPDVIANPTAVLVKAKDPYWQNRL